MSKVTTPEQEIKNLKEENSQLKFEIDDAFKHSVYNRKAEVWLKCFTAVIISGDTANAEFTADTLAKEYWSRFK